MRLRHVGGRVLRLATLVSILWALAGFAPGPVDSRIQFPGGVHVPRAVQMFAWRVIETSCNYQSYELQQHSFWAYDVKTRQTDAGVAYSIHILSEVPWKKTIPPAFIDMTVVDDGGVRLAALTSSIVVCTPPKT